MGVTSSGRLEGTTSPLRQDSRRDVKRVLLIALTLNVSMTLLKLVIVLLSG